MYCVGSQQLLPDAENHESKSNMIKRTGITTGRCCFRETYFLDAMKFTTCRTKMLLFHLEPKIQSIADFHPSKGA